MVLNWDPSRNCFVEDDNTAIEPPILLQHHKLQRKTPLHGR
jgi:hypothetical protein